MSNATETQPAVTDDPVMWAKDASRGMMNLERNQIIQRARDAALCVCGHKNVSHGYGTDAGPAWRDGSRIGRGPCGIETNASANKWSDPRTFGPHWDSMPCPCQTFTADSKGTAL